MQDSLTLACKHGPSTTEHPGSCNFGVDVFGGSDVKVRDVTISGTFGNGIRVFNSQGSPAQHVANATARGQCMGAEEMCVTWECGLSGLPPSYASHCTSWES